MSIRALATAALLLLPGCSAPRIVPEVPFEDELEEFQGAFHVHLDPTRPFEDELFDLKEGCAVAMLDFVVVVDDGLSQERARALFDATEGPVFIPAVELENGLLAVGLRRPVPPRADAQEIRRRGGLAILRLPVEAAWDPVGADGVELYDLEETVGRQVRDLAEWRKGISERKGTEIVAELDERRIRRWDDLNQKGRLLGLAAHATHHGASARLSYEEAFQLLTVHVQARTRTRDAILGALRQDCVVFFNALNSFSRAAVTVGSSEGGESRLIISWSNAVEAEHHVFLDGQEVTLTVARMMGFGLSYAHEFSIDRPGLYRVRADLPRGGRARPWYLSNPVRAVSR